jgi:uncharacterized protein YndB with AHSA1/START domain
MATTPHPAVLDTIAGRPVLRFARRLAHPPEKVWRAITDPAELANWFPATVDIEPRVGGTMRFTFEGEEQPATGEILEIDPPKVLAYSWSDDVLRFELVPDGSGCRLLFSHTISETTGGRFAAGRNAAGWDACLAALEARLAGSDFQPPRDMFGPIADYTERFGLAAGEVREDREDGGGQLVRFEWDLVWIPAKDVWAVLTGADEPAAGATPPPPATTERVPAGPVTLAEPPNVLEYQWMHDGSPAGRVRWEMSEHPLSGHRVVVTQTVPAAHQHRVPEILSAWRTHLVAFFLTLGKNRS